MRPEKQLSFPWWRIYASQIPLFLLYAQGETYKTVSGQDELSSIASLMEFFQISECFRVVMYAWFFKCDRWNDTDYSFITNSKPSTSHVCIILCIIYVILCLYFEKHEQENITNCTIR